MILRYSFYHWKQPQLQLVLLYKDWNLVLFRRPDPETEPGMARHKEGDWRVVVSNERGEHPLSIHKKALQRQQIMSIQFYCSWCWYSHLFCCWFIILCLLSSSPIRACSKTRSCCSSTAIWEKWASRPLMWRGGPQRTGRITRLVVFAFFIYNLCHVSWLVHVQFQWWNNPRN